MQKRFLLTHRHAPGDTVVLTALFRDIKRAYPDFEIGFDGHAKDIVQNNPYLSHFELNKDGTPVDKQVQALRMCYRDGIRRQNHETCHFLAEFHRNFAQQTGFSVPLTEPRPDIHLSDFERDTPIVEGRYWLFLSGGKSDFTAKVWDHRSWTRLVHMMRERGVPMVQTGALNKGHWHPNIPGALNLVGRTNLRDLIRLIWHAEGVFSHVSCAMHIAAALEKPCVVIAGGREAWFWEAYVVQNRGLVCPERLRVPHQYLHTIGLLPCCATRGCWKSKVLPTGGDKSVCKQPVILPGQAVPECLTMITPEHALEAAMSYIDNSYPPIKDRSAIIVPPPTTVLAPPPLLLPTAALTVNQAAAPPPRATPTTDHEIFDHEAIGGKFTAFVLLYGPNAYHSMHRRCVDSLITSVPPDRLDLRIGSNALCKESVEYVEQLRAAGIVSKHYRHPGNDKKYPVMREMFYDPTHPITTKWLLWFDDDSIADRNRNWLTLLSQQIVTGVEANCQMYGAKFIWTLQNGQAAWIKTRPWYRGRPFRTANGRPAPNGDKILFAAGGFWALSTEAMRACDIPDVELQHNGGDYTCGEQLYQGGYELKAWNGQKQFIHTSSVPRRGLSETHIGIKPRVPHRVVT